MDNELSQRIIGCAFEVSNCLGSGFLECVYEKALCVELTKNNIAFVRQKPVTVRYKGIIVGEYVTDIIVENTLLLDLKATSAMPAAYSAQLMNYLKATGLSLGLILNFGTTKLGIKRMVWDHEVTSNN